MVVSRKPAFNANTPPPSPAPLHRISRQVEQQIGRRLNRRAFLISAARLAAIGSGLAFLPQLLSESTAEAKFPQTFGDLAEIDVRASATGGPALGVLGENTAVLAWADAETNELYLKSATSMMDLPNATAVPLHEPCLSGPALGGDRKNLFIGWTNPDNHLKVALIQDPTTGKISPPHTLLDPDKDVEETSYLSLALSQGPANRLYVAWTGTDENSTLNIVPSLLEIPTMAATNTIAFDTKRTLVDLTSAAAPSLYGGLAGIGITWVGTDEDHQLNLAASNNGRTFPSTTTFTKETSSVGAALSGAGQVLAWTGMDRDSSLNVVTSKEFPFIDGIKRTYNKDSSSAAPALIEGFPAGGWIAWTGRTQKVYIAKFI